MPLKNENLLGVDGLSAICSSAFLVSRCAVFDPLDESRLLNNHALPDSYHRKVFIVHKLVA